MNLLRILCPLLLSFLLAPMELVAGTTSLAMVAIEVPTAKEAEAIVLLEAKKIPTIAWSNAVVEVSNFDAIGLRPLASLGLTLTAEDPRWDPWLSAQKNVFLPSRGVSRLWVEESQHQEALQTLGSLVGSVPESRRGSSEVSARQVTGWMALLGGLLYAGLRFFVEWKHGLPGWKAWKQWLWLAVVLLVVVGAAIMIGSGWFFSSRNLSAPHSSEVSWSRHLWFQTAWPYGATWEDSASSKPWSYDTYERKEGRVVSSRRLLANFDQQGLTEQFEALDPHHAARVFGLEKP